jgi:hypothetical protein
VNGFFGLGYRVGSPQSSFGGNYAYSLTKNVMPYAEISYFPGFTANQDISVPFPIILPDRTVIVGTARTREAIPYFDTHAGVHLRVPISGKRWVPYGAIGAGASTTRATKYPVHYSKPRSSAGNRGQRIEIYN